MTYSNYITKNKFPDISGLKINKLTVICRNEQNIKDKPDWQRNRLWNCKCDCGKESIHREHSLRQRKIQSCGCARLGKNGPRKLRHIDTFNGIIARYRCEANRRNHKFNLTKTQFVSIVGKRCFYCNIKPSNTVNYYGRIVKYNGIDRVDNNRGYNIKNCVPCCIRCNNLKGGITIKMIKKINKFLDLE